MRAGPEPGSVEVSNPTAMHASLPPSLARSCRSRALVPALLCAAFASACGGSSGGNGQSGIPGQELAKPGGGTFFVDENGSGGRTNLGLAEVRWGRLVDVHEVDAAGDRVELPVFRDMVIEPTILTGGSYVLDRNQVTQRERLTIKARKNGVPDPTDFDDLLAAARNQLPVVSIKNVSAAPPFTAVPRNACLVVRFDDCLDDDTAAAVVLGDTVEVFTGYPPVTPFEARVVFDPNHGAMVSGAFHTTRVLVDMTTSEAEASALPVIVGVNPVGMPASQENSPSSNVSLRIATRVDVGSGQFAVLTNLAGAPLDEQKNGPMDPNSPSLDVVRALRSGNPDVTIIGGSNGFLLDLERPRLIGAWPITISSATNDGAGDPGFDFLLDLEFTTSCLDAPEVGDVVTINGSFLEVSEAATLTGVGVTDLKVRSAAFVGNSLTLQGDGLYQAPFLPSALELGCWVSFLPEADEFPAGGVSTTASILLRFNEPMDPATLSPFRDFLVVKGGEGSNPTAHNVIVGEVVSNDLSVFTFDPTLSLPHVNGDVNSRLHVELIRPRDLAGNRLRHDLPPVEFLIDENEPDQDNGSIVLRLDDDDEYGPAGGGPDSRGDLRGQFFYDGERGSIFPRPVAVSGWPADRTIPVPARMTQGFFSTVPVPLNPLGAKLQTLWRHCDVGWIVRDETKYNLDVIGLNWAPLNGAVQSDFFELFEIRLGHSRWLPDEGAAGAWPTSGLPAGTPFEGNYLNGSNQRVVHSRTLGYFVNPSERFNSTSGIVMMPFPLNKGTTPDVTYTWRDTSILTEGADGGITGGMTPTPGVPTGIEVEAGAPGPAGSLFAVRKVKTIGLPLLMEFNCFPSDSGLGNNNPELALPNLGAPSPNFRAYSAGGFNSAGTATPVLPDSELTPKGGFNPFSTPPGILTPPVDRAFFYGQLDTVVRISRVHTAWLDSGLNGVTEWQSPVLEPLDSDQPAGTAVLLDFRSAVNFSGSGGTSAPFNAPGLNPYGDPPPPNPSFSPVSLSDWSSDITLSNGKQYLQVRITFVNNPSTGLSPELSALALPFLK